MSLKIIIIPILSRPPPSSIAPSASSEGGGGTNSADNVAVIASDSAEKLPSRIGSTENLPSRTGSTEKLASPVKPATPVSNSKPASPAQGPAQESAPEASTVIEAPTRAPEPEPVPERQPTPAAAAPEPERAPTPKPASPAPAPAPSPKPSSPAIAVKTASPIDAPKPEPAPAPVVAPNKVIPAVTKAEAPTVSIPREPTQGQVNGVSPPPHVNKAPAHLNSSTSTVPPRLSQIANKGVDLPRLERWRKKSKDFWDSTEISILMSLVTIWALFGDDFRIMWAPKEADVGWTATMSICFFLFAFEFFANCFSSPIDYMNWTYEWGEKVELRHLKIGSFFAYLDIIATVSLGFEISWMNGTDDTEFADDFATNNSGRGNTDLDGYSSKLVTMSRMVRIVRMVKFYKYYQTNKKIRDKKQKLEERGRSKSFNKKMQQLEQELEQEEGKTESRVGTAMTDLTTQRVLILVFSLLFVIPLLSETSEDLTVRYTAHLAEQMYETSIYYPAFTGLNHTLDFFTDELPVLAVMHNDNFLTHRDDSLEELSGFRVSEVLTFSNNDISVYFDNRLVAVDDALWHLLLSIFVVILLMTGTYYFSKDVTLLVITPIEAMVGLVQKISVDPLGVDYASMGATEDEGFMDGMETTLLMKTINKIGSLMRVGFGEAGANVIARNLAESKGGKLNMMGAGITITSIFGFCDVRNFTDTTECLQEEVMLFVNRIAHILHSIVVQCSGSANKNIGDAFLLTWKLEDNMPNAKRMAIADQALVAFLKALVDLSRHQDFICNFSTAATTRLFKRFPGYNVRIGCGLHVGWAIEGAIGSYRKIDASYLSPSVNMAEYLESSTKAYGVPILLSEPFYNLLSPQATKYIRQVDRVFGPLADPFGMYTYDSDLDYDFNAIVATEAALKAASVFKSKLAARKEARDAVKANAGRRRSSLFMGLTAEGIAAAKENRAKRGTVIAVAAPVRRGSAFNDIEMQKLHEKQRQLQEERKNKAPEIKVQAYESGVWERDTDLIQLRHKVNESFRATWRVGIEAYISGDWPKAQSVFNETLKITKGTDGPSLFLLALMEKNNFVAPKDWEGYRLD